MDTIEINGKDGKLKLHLPTSVYEITPEVLLDATKHIVVAPDYSLVAVVYSTSLAIAVNEKKAANARIGVIPLFVKCGDNDSSFINNINAGDKLIIAPSNVALGIHVNNGFNELSLSRICNLCSQDIEFMKCVFTYNDTYYFVNYKLIPNCNINGVIKNNVIHANRFIEVADNKES